MSAPRLADPTTKTSASRKRLRLLASIAPTPSADALLEPRSAAGGDRAGGAPLLEHDAAALGEVEQALALLPLAGTAEEEVGEGAERDERALDHHDRAGGALVGERRDSPVGLALLVDGVEHGPRPHQDVAEDDSREADAERVAE